MNKLLFFILLLVITACSDGVHTLIRDDLYSDKNGNLYLKSENKEDVENKKDVWLTEVFCETCEDDLHELKDFVDVATFQYDSYLEQEDVRMYADKKYWYRHKRMADGGTISVEAK